MKPIAILIAGDPVPQAKALQGGFEAMVRRHVGHEQAWLDVDLRTAAALPEPEAIAGAIITGSASSVTDREDWTLRGEELLRKLVASELPVLGICYGHQMLGQALGGEVKQNPNGREIGTVKAHQHEVDPIVGELPHYAVNSSHVDSVVTLPQGVQVLASTALEPNAAVRFGEQAWGVQFHPEFDAAVMRAYIEARRERLAEELLDPELLLAEVAETPAAPEILRRFVAHVRSPANR